MKKCELSIPGETRIALGVNEANRLHKYATAQAEMPPWPGSMPCWPCCGLASY